MKYFYEDSTRPNRALQAWLVLIAKANAKQTLTYTELDMLMKFGNPRALGTILDYIAAYCQYNRIPILSVLVVQKGTGVPGEGAGEIRAGEFERVFNYDWYSVIPPSADDLDWAYRSKSRQI